MQRGQRPKRGDAFLAYRDGQPDVLDVLAVTNCDAHVRCFAEGEHYAVHLTRGSGQFEIGVRVHFLVNKQGMLEVTTWNEGLVEP